MDIIEIPRGGRRPGAGRKAQGEENFDLRIRTYREDRERLERLRKPGESQAEAVRRILREYEQSTPATDPGQEGE